MTRSLGQVPVIEWGITSFGNSSRCQLGYVRLEGVSIVIDERIPTSIVGEPQAPDEERGHLPTGDRVVGTVLVIEWGITSLGDSASCQPFDICVEEVISWYVDEPWGGRHLEDGRHRDNGNLCCVTVGYRDAQNV